MIQRILKLKELDGGLCDLLDKEKTLLYKLTSLTEITVDNEIYFVTVGKRCHFSYDRKQEIFYIYDSKFIFDFNRTYPMSLDKLYKFISKTINKRTGLIVNHSKYIEWVFPEELKIKLRLK